MSSNQFVSSPDSNSLLPEEEPQPESQRVEDSALQGDSVTEGQLAPVAADPDLAFSERINENYLPPQDDEPILPVIGLGGSAGSIGALQEFFGRIPTDLGIAYVVVMHLSSDFESQLPQVLQTRTRMPVVQVQGSAKVEADHIYVIPPLYHLRMENGHIHTSLPEQDHGKRVAIDLFFRTLAASHRSRAVAVVLSGMDGDGTIGIKRVKEHGGVTIAQDPAEAEYPSMPRSAIETGMVDWILTIEQMASKITQWIGNERKIHLPPAQSDEGAPQLMGEEADETALREVLSFLHTHTGHDFSHYKRASTLRRIMRRLQVNSLESLPQYASFLRTHPGETGALLQDLLISVTNFFRDPEAFSALETYVPRLFRDKKPSDAVRVWVAGCATGEEAYSLAILIEEYAQTLDNPPDIQIFASDLDEQALHMAREAIYPATIAADVSPERLQRYFVLDQGRYRIKKYLRERVLFAAHNLLRDAPFSRLDLVSCRNVLIYFGRAAQDKVLDIFHFALKSNGTLFLGGSESADDRAFFTAQDKKHRIYEREVAVRSQLPMLSASVPMPPRAVEMARFTPAATLATNIRSAPTLPASYSDLHLRLLEQTAPPSVLVNVNYEIVHLSEHAGRFLRLAGEATMNLLSLVHPALRLELRTALFRALQTGEDVDIPAIPIERNGQVRHTGARVRPMHEREDSSGSHPFILVIFDEVEAAADAPPAVPTAPDATAWRLDEELQYLKEQVRASAEQYEASSEELQASNEELQAMNEEQRSATEELETSREEIQAANEELTTVNAELKLKIEEILGSNSDLQNLVASTDIATVFLSRDLTIKRYTPRAVELFRLIPSDVGRPLADLRHGFGTQTLTEDADRVLRTLATIEREVTSENGLWFLLRVSPYRTLDDRIDGVVLAFVDITERKRAEELLRGSQQRLQQAINIETVGVIFFNNAIEITDCNDAFVRMSGWTRAEIRAGQFSWELFTPEEFVKPSHHAIEELRTQGFSTPYEKEYIRKDGSRFWALFACKRIDENEMVEFVTDITERKRAEAAVLESEARQRFLVKLGDALRPLRDPIEIQAVASRILGEQLGVERAYYVEIDEASREFIVARDWHQPGAPSHARRYPLEDWSMPWLNNGQIWVMQDVDSESVLPNEQRASYRGNDIRAAIVVPLLKEEHLVATFTVNQNAPRGWMPQEVELVRETAERTWAAVERARAEFLLARSEEKYRTLFDLMDEAYAVVEVLADELGQWSDFRYVEVNPAFRKHTGIEFPVGRTATELLGTPNPRWAQIYGQVAETGEAVRVEEMEPALSRIFDLNIFRLGEAESRSVAVLFSDVTERKHNEVTLIESLQRLALATESAQIGIWDWDVTADKMVWDAQMFALYGVREQDFSGAVDAWQSGLHPEDREQAESDIAAALEGKRDFQSQFRVIWPGGEVRFIEAHAVVQRADDGSALRMIGINWDITQRNQDEEALRLSEERYRSLTQATAQIIWTISPDGKTMENSPTWRDYTGQSSEEGQGWGWLHALHPDDSEAFVETWLQCVEAKSLYETEYRLRSADGNYRLFAVRGVPVLDEGGQIREWVGTCTDIHDRRAAEEERDRFFTISLDLLCIADQKGYFKRLNPAFEATLGHSNSELMAKPFLEWVHPDDREATLAVMQDLDAGISTLKFANRYRCGDGSYRWLSWTSVPFDDSIYAAAHDITAIKAAEAALHQANDELELRVARRTTQLETANESLRIENIERQMTMETLRQVAEAFQLAKEEADRANAAKSEFLSRMSHELRTPLNAILGFGQILERQNLTPLQLESIGHILKGGNHLLGLVNEILDISRVEAGQSEMIIEPVALAALVAESCDLVRPLIGDGTIQLVDQLRVSSSQNALQNRPRAMLADRQRLRQVLLNLLSNAIKYNREGGKVEVSARESENGHIQLRVQDTGVGLTPQELQKLFTPFERLHAADSTIKGTGLGLVISRRLIEAMGGTLDVESTEGEGSTFWIELPGAEVSAPDPFEAMEAQEDTPFSPAEGTSTVLYIEDNTSNLRLVETIFEMRPQWRLLSAMQGQIGLDLAREQAPNLILLDLNLPDMPGTEVLAHLQQSLLTCEIPVVVLSADATPKQIEQLLNSGAKAYLTKPFHVRQLLSTLDEALQKIAPVA